MTKSVINDNKIQGYSFKTRVIITASILFPISTLASAEPSVERGEYLVRGPARCGNCHTSKTADGPDMSDELGGFMVFEVPTGCQTVTDSADG